MTISVSKKNLKRYVEEICSRSPRYPGTDGEAKTREYIASQGKELGVSVELEEFEYLHYWPKSSKLEVLTPIESSLDNLPLCYAGSGIAEGDVVYVGSGSQQEFELLEKEGIDIEGKVVLASNSATFIPYMLAQQYGAAGLVFLSNAPDNLPRAGNATLDHSAGKIPAVAVPSVVGQGLLMLMSTGRLKLRVASGGEFSTKTSANVIMTIPGKTIPHEQVILVAHYDSHNLGKHANDNASGCAGILELVRIFRQVESARTVKAIFTGVEEFGLWGAYAYVDRHIDEILNIKAVVALDAIGNSYDSKFQLMATKGIHTLALSVVKESGCEVECKELRAGDHFPFQIRGVPAMWLTGGSLFLFYHTERDDPELLDYNQLKSLSDIEGAIVYKIANQKRLS